MNKCTICRTEDARSMHEYFCEGCFVSSGAGRLRAHGVEHLVNRLQKLEDRNTDGVIKVKSNAIVNENISAELGIPDAKDIITVQGVSRDHDGQWVRRSSYNELSDEMQRRTVQLKQTRKRIREQNIEMKKLRDKSLFGRDQHNRTLMTELDENGYCEFSIEEDGFIRTFIVEERKGSLWHK